LEPGWQAGGCHLSRGSLTQMPRERTTVVNKEKTLYTSNGGVGTSVGGVESRLEGSYYHIWTLYTSNGGVGTSVGGVESRLEGSYNHIWTLYTSNANTTTSRTHMVVKASRDAGRTWSEGVAMARTLGILAVGPDGQWQARAPF